MINQYITIFLMLIVLPVVSAFEARKLRKEYNDTAKSRAYWKVHAMNWFFIITIPLIVPLSDIIVPLQKPYLSWYVHLVLIIIILMELFDLVFPLIMARFDQSFKRRLENVYNQKMRAVYPVTKSQQIMFLFVSVSVGIGEEIMYRGFLFNFAVSDLNLNVWTSFIIVSIVFGLAHFHQGLRGIYNGLKLGVIFGYLYFATGFLLVPIIIHILYNMKIVWLAYSINTHNESK